LLEAWRRPDSASGIAHGRASGEGQMRAGKIGIVVAMLSSVLVAGAGAGPAAATANTVSLTMDCVSQAPVLGAQYTTQDVTFTTDAPATVLPGANFTVTAATPVGQIPSSQSVATVSSVKDISYKIPVPANASFVSASLSGGFNYGATAPTVVLSGSATTGSLIFSVPGPIPTDQNYQLPAVTVTFTAVGADYSTIEPHLGGTSYSDPGFTTTAVVTSPISGNVPTSCYPIAPNPAWSSTVIAPPDVTPPTITLSTPADGGQYPLDGSVAANYFCNDGTYGSGVATCDGTVANGSPIDTSSLGTHTFTVTASDADGNVSTPVTHTYSVVPAGNDHTPPEITLTSPANGAVYQQNQAVAAAYSCLDNGSGISTCAGTVADGAAIDTSTTGPHSFTVSASDGEGNTYAVLHSYSVMPPAVQQNWTTGDVTNRMPVGCDTLLNSFHESIPVASNTAPTMAGAGGQFAWSMAIDTDVVPTLNNGTNLIYRWKKPTNGHFVSAAFTGPGSQVNGATIAINANGTLQLNIASVTDQSILGFGDDSFKPPPFRAVIQVDGAPGSLVRNMFDYFEITTTTIGLLTTTQHCPAGDTYNNRTNVPLTTTLVVDDTPPTITVSSPVNGQTYAANAPLTLTYACTDDTSTPTCTGDVPSGTALDTSTSGTHTVQVTSVDPTGNTAAQTVSYTIADPTVSVGDASVVEAPGATVDFPVTLSNPSSQTVTVTYNTADGTAVAPTDYTALSGTVSFAPGEVTKYVSVPVTATQYFAGSRTLTLSLLSPVKAVLGTASATGTITGATPPAVSVGNVSVTEAPGATLDFAVSIAAQPAYPLTVDYQTVDGSASAPARYGALSGTLTWNPGDPLVQHVVVSVVNDTIYNEGGSTDNTQTMSLATTETVNGTTASGTGTIVDDEVQPPVLRIGDVSIREGDDHTRTVKVTVTLNHPSNQQISVNYTTQSGSAPNGAVGGANAKNGTDFKAKAGGLIFRPKVVSKVISLAVYGDTTSEGDETFTVKLSNAAPANGVFIARDTGTVTILDDDTPASAPSAEASVTDVTMYEGGGGRSSQAVFTVSLSRRPTAPVTITYQLVGDTATAGADFTAKTGTLSFSTTQVSKAVAVKIVGDDDPEPDETFRLVISSTSPGVTITDDTGIGTIRNDD
jgi:hypothetical protein